MRKLLTVKFYTINFLLNQKYSGVNFKIQKVCLLRLDRALSEGKSDGSMSFILDLISTPTADLRRAAAPSGMEFVWK